MRPMHTFVVLVLTTAALAAPRAQAPAVAPAPAPASSTATSRFPLTVDSIMRGPDLVGYPPTGLRWAGDGSRLFFEWQARGDDETATWVVNADGTGLTRLSEEQRRLAPPPTGQWDRARRRLLAAQKGDVVLFDTVAGTRVDLTRTAGTESSPRWARQETAVTFVRDGGLYLLPLSGGGLQQIVESGPKANEPRRTPSQEALAEQEAELLEHVRETKRKREREEARRKAEALPRIETGARQSVVDMQLDGTGRYVFAVLTERPEAAKSAVVPDYVTESGYVTDLPSRTMVGDTQAKSWLVVVDLETRKTTPATLAALGGSAAGQTPREARWSMPVLSDDGTVAVASVRSADNKDRWLVRIDPATGEATVLDHLHDDAWVREGGGFGASGFGFLPGGTRLWFLSERTGWMHLYAIDVAQGGPPVALTSGDWEVTSVELSVDRGTFYITSTEAGAGERHLHAMATSGGARTRLTTATGGHQGVVSPDGRTIGLISSTGNTPPDVFVMPYGGTAATRVTTSASPEWLAYRWLDPQVVTFEARDGVKVPARLYTPEMVGAKRHPSRPAVVFVHGAGYLQNAHRYWSQYYREYMFHHLLASKGYVVLDVDYRGSAGYGRDWRTAIYRHMGGKDLDDIVDGAKYLVATQRVNPRHIGLYGGSYGGFITLMAMFTTPEVFAAGAALRPVTDWAHYNHGYTSNILNVPQEDKEAYRRSSPIFFADGLKGALLICHGLVDTNVHAQDSIRLAQKLIELRKENWELALYPVEDHGFEEAASWADEYKRILKLFENNLK